MMVFGAEDFCFSKTAALQPRGKYVVLIHGWGVRAWSMRHLANALAENGYDAFNYDYPTAKLNIEGHADVFLKRYRELLLALPSDAEVYFLTHSMGALLLRGAMSNMTLQECRRIKCIVMLGPPNRGSKLAYFGKLPFVSVFNASLGDMVPGEESFASKLKEPVYMPPVGIIAGNMDGKVSIDSTKLPENFEYKHLVVKSTHPGLRKPKNVMQYVLRYFDKFDFDVK